MPIPDADARERAAVAADRNVVVTAGAGTGKTTLLVDRLTHLLLREPAPLRIDEIVALTFTNKAANEMKLRLRERLLAFRELSRGAAVTAGRGREAEALRALRERYGIGPAQVDERTTAALHDLERSQIGTIHSFAAHLIRLHPVEAGVDPGFQQDEGERQAAYFQARWDQWLDRELGPDGARHGQWRRVLGLAPLEDLRELAWRLSREELIPLAPLLQQTRATAMPAPVRAWLAELLEEGRALRAAHPKTLTLERLLDLAMGRLERVVAQAGAWVGPEDEGLERSLPAMTKDWTAIEYERAKTIVKVAQGLGRLDEGLADVLHLLAPFAEDCRRGFVQTGYLSFDGLLASARDLLVHHPAVRRELKRSYKAILVDEFQDTDPVQYEIILCLAEALGREESDWRRFQLAPGKLFIVGDPKQSIYAFRRADMQAYDAVVGELVLAGGTPGAHETLETNFRSHRALLDILNAFFAPLFPSGGRRGVQPRYEPLRPADEEDRSGPSETVQLRLVRPGEPEADADGATRAEAEELARWLAEAMGREEILDRGARVTLRPGHVAILFRTLTAVRDYVEALRRYGLPSLTEGERYFYQRQEVVDVVNLLRAAVHPDDRLALVSVLRSPLGGLSDVEIERLIREHALDYRRVSSSAPALYAALRELHRELPRLPLTEVVPRLFERLPLLEVAAASAEGEQAVANLLKLEQLADALASRIEMTLPGLVRELTRRLLDVPEETESPLTEEAEDEGALGAVRLLSIHKAKGLEFPVVILAGLHRGTDRRESRVMVHHDWCTGVMGLRLGERQTLGGLYLASRLAERQQAEQLRLLYVAMTRARRRLVLSAGLPRSISRDSFLWTVMTRLALHPDELADAEVRTVSLGERAVPVEVVQARPATRTAPPAAGEWMDAAEDLTAGLADVWQQRRQRYERSLRLTPFLTPTRLQAASARPPDSSRPAGPSAPGSRRSEDRDDPDRSRLIGTLAHRILEGWDFTRPAPALVSRVHEICRRSVPDDGMRDELTAELVELCEAFTASAAYARLKRATILGYEVPFLMPWQGDVRPTPAGGGWSDGAGGQTGGLAVSVMEGVIDLLYELDGQVWVADYKTDRVAVDEVAGRAEAYRPQAEVYLEAVRRGLGQPTVRMELLFLRCGEAYEVPPR